MHLFPTAEVEEDYDEDAAPGGKVEEVEDDDDEEGEEEEDLSGEVKLFALILWNGYLNGCGMTTSQSRL